MKLLQMVRSIPKTVYFNFKYFKFKDAIKFPVIVSHSVYLMRTQGKVNIQSEGLRTGMIKLGFGEVGIFDGRRSRSVWNVQGTVNFKGSAAIGHGNKISVEEGGVLTLGDNLIITAESAIVCRKNIDIRSDVMMSWQVQIMDSDLHDIMDGEGRVINKDKDIVIGEKCWIGARTLILKGVDLKKGTIVAAGSILTGSVVRNTAYRDNLLIGGNPPQVIKENVSFRV